VEKRGRRLPRAPAPDGRRWQRTETWRGGGAAADREPTAESAFLAIRGRRPRGLPLSPTAYHSSVSRSSRSPVSYWLSVFFLRRRKGEESRGYSLPFMCLWCVVAALARAPWTVRPCPGVRCRAECLAVLVRRTGKKILKRLMERILINSSLVWD
jgi:hypothetical protein